MIVKVQLPTDSNEDDPEALVYDETREFETFIPVTKNLLKIMNKKIKAYFHAHVENEDELVFDDEAPAQLW